MLDKNVFEESLSVWKNAKLLESYILDLMKKFFENAANDFRCR